MHPDFLPLLFNLTIVQNSRAQSSVMKIERGKPYYGEEGGDQEDIYFLLLRRMTFDSILSRIEAELELLLI